MKKTLCGCCLALLVCLLSSCGNATRLDLSRGYGDNLKLIHLSASAGESFQRIQAFAQVLEDAEPLEKDIALFAYYPDYVLEITAPGEARKSAVVDINGEFVDFYFLGEDSLYRSRVSAEDFLELVHQA